MGEYIGKHSSPTYEVVPPIMIKSSIVTVYSPIIRPLSMEIQRCRQLESPQFLLSLFFVCLYVDHVFGTPKYGHGRERRQERVGGAA